eukprot:TRINITY_DN601_c0_g2_i22.p1 TRINITY_DN601_c0_g2~~TRINITY_DN601_c0_g2_i22.p1  ORF type:complete len:146 (-),score=32.05 TRINITY_DN601_c0_g2_i22:30-431(-)
MGIVSLLDTHIQLFPIANKSVKDLRLGLKGSSGINAEYGMLEVECTTDSAEEVKWPTNPIPRSKNLPNTQFTLIKKEHKMLTTAQSSIWKDGQLATDLSNERTLLAWVGSGSFFTHLIRFECPVLCSVWRWPF